MNDQPADLRADLPILSQDRRIYAIGDIHGRADLLDMIEHAIAREESIRPPARTVEIVLGDFIDRGSQSREVVERLLLPPIGRERIVLRGNHEAMLLRFLTRPETFADWRDLGGIETLSSYGVTRGPASTPRQMIALRDEALQKIPQNHIDFINRTPLVHLEDGYLFVHAGIRPDVPLERQRPEDLMWIREPFLNWAKKHPYHVVHGHTPVADIDMLHNRTNVDTGAYATNRLSCLILEHDKVQGMTTHFK